MLNIRVREDLWKFTKQFVKFGIVGVSNTVISLMVYYFFVLIDNKLFLLGNTIGFLVSVAKAYYWNSRFVFKKTESGHAKPFIKSLISYGTTFLLGTGFLFMMVNSWDVSEAIAPLVNLMVTVPVNFLLNKFWAFK